MKKETCIHYGHPATRTLAQSLKCLPRHDTEKSIAKIAEEALEEVRKRYIIPCSLSFSVMTLNEELMTARLTALTQEYMAMHKEPEKEALMKWLVGTDKNTAGHYLLTPAEERILIRAVQDNVPGAMEIALTFFALKAVCVLRPYMYNINRSNSADIEAACYEAMLRVLYDFDLDTYPMGLAQGVISPTMRNLVMEELGMCYPATLHRRQMGYIHRLHLMMQDADFAALPPYIRAQKAHVPIEIIDIYDYYNPDTTATGTRRRNISDKVDNSGEYDGFEDYSSIRSDLDRLLVEDMETFHKLLQDPVVKKCLTDLHNAVASAKYEKVKIRRARKALDDLKGRFEESPAEWDTFMEEVAFCAAILAEHTDFFRLGDS